MADVVKRLEDKHLLKTSQGAEIVDLSAYNLNPALIKKSDGATLYMTRDLAAAIFRKEHYHFVQSLYVVGNEQRDSTRTRGLIAFCGRLRLTRRLKWL